MKNPEAVLSTKPHFEILDGLRGVAALAVVIFHFMEWIYPDSSQNFIGHGFLAVDFFFCLSGFVIGYAYDNRLPQMGLKEFFRRRIIRLHPLVVFGSVLGLIGLLVDPFAASPVAYSNWQLLLFFLCSIFLIPLPVMEDRAFNQFGLNAPAWSLFWEYVANICYALFLTKLGRRPLAVLTVIAGLVLFMVSYRDGNITGGWGKGNFWVGGARLAYSFSAGLLVYRSGWKWKNKLGFAGLAVLLSLALVMPGSADWNWLTEPLVVLFYFPLLVSLGAGARLSGGMKKFCDFSGKLSYPLYMTHYWGIWFFGSYLTNQKPTGSTLVLIVLFGTMFLVAFAYGVMVLFDIPVRKYLSGKRKKNVALTTDSKVPADSLP